MDLQEFEGLIAQVTDKLQGRDVDASLTAYLDEVVPSDGALFQKITDACHVGVADGWLCQHSAGGIDYGRAIKQGPATHGFSVDVVRMKDLKGPHHAHPNGEIDMNMPIDAAAKFDGAGKGWLVYGPDTAHHPTVTDGEALVLYLLPDGAIDFTRN
ncbi:MAG: DUF4863 family protein [Alphaproteobacteria bacterium]|jgi:hypothetical protein|nr:DUF4863 family protein [Alphaproteobacteria bacterium]MBT4020478.1 DUF4863 family protein [Alphaproteobacteria bacterium]MBT4964987.1 DUF4863 family protein [Alphaproteobacteria bacterium]MBT5161236.1 DUF4863 family protein [Alphaproteobacteria bacterium]MBT5918568.1 DUF4863 family protein [Alphaproteobacteria bacterium]